MASTSTFTCNTEREPENEGADAFQGISRSPPACNAFEGIAPSPSASGRSTMPEKKLPYDVFINHRGPDVKDTLAATLYKTLTGMGLRVFLDKEELEYGDFLPSEIEEAMRGALLHISIFSENYAQSPWCLAELSFMLKTGTQIVPVFYHVEPDVVRYAKGAYADAFSHHQNKGRYNSETLQNWKNALNNVSFNVGPIVRNKHDEGMLLKSIVNRVLKEIKNVPFVVAKHPIGLDEAVTDFERTTLQSVETHHSVQMVGIWGMGGSGKTTLAKQLYNNKYATMEKSSFLLDIRDATSKSVLHKKQQKLLEDLGLQGLSVNDIEEGKGILANRLRYIQVLIILDDVDTVDQLDALAPEKDSVGHGSLIVVTTRKLEVLQGWGISSIYKMKELSPPHAKQLYCWHAFLKPCPLDGFEEFVEKFIEVSQGLPLSLKVFGGQLYNRSNKDYWENQLQKIVRILPDDIKNRLKVSYDALDFEEKEAFLDAACFFIGEKKTLAIAAWDGSTGSGLCSWEGLLNKCLVEINDDDCIRMHDHLRDLGRDIANHESPYRLWSPLQIINVGSEVQGIAIRGIMATAAVSHRYSWGRKLIFNTSRGSRSMPASLLGLKFFHARGNYYNKVIGDLSRELVWLRWTNIEKRSLRSLGSLKKLRVLQLYGNYSGKHCLKELWKTGNNAPAQLRELVIDGCSEFQGFPKSIGYLKHLRKIVVRHGNIMRSLPEEFCLLQSLEYLELDGSELLSLPNSFGDLKNLRHLRLAELPKVTSLPEEFCLLQSLEYLELDAGQLLSLPSTFGDLRNLRHLELFGCVKLRRLPVSFKELTLLQYLSIENCSNLTLESDIMESMTKIEYLEMNCRQLEELPRHIRDQTSLKDLICYSDRLREVPLNIGQLNKLQRMVISSELLTSLPTSIGDLSTLTYLKICNSRKLKWLPDSLGCLSLLNSLMIESLGVESLPKSVRHLNNLHTLEIKWCPISELDLRAGLFTCLTQIVLHSTEVSKISIPEDCCPGLQVLDVHNNDHLTEIEVLPNTLEQIILEGCPKLDALPSFAQSAFLRRFTLGGCYKVKKIQGLEHCRTLRVLEAYTRWEETGIESLERMEGLRIVGLKAISRSAVEGCIQSMQKWPEEIIVCSQAVPDVATLAKHFAFSNLSVVDSFANRKIKSDPSLKWPSTPRCILICFVMNCKSPRTFFKLTVGYSNRRNHFQMEMELEEGKWLWTALLRQDSRLHRSISINKKPARVYIYSPIFDVNGREVLAEVEGVIEKGLLVMGEEERIVEAFTRLCALLSN